MSEVRAPPVLCKILSRLQRRKHDETVGFTYVGVPDVGVGECRSWCVLR